MRQDADAFGGPAAAPQVSLKRRRLYATASVTDYPADKVLRVAPRFYLLKYVTCFVHAFKLSTS